MDDREEVNPFNLNGPMANRRIKMDSESTVWFKRTADEMLEAISHDLEDVFHEINHLSPKAQNGLAIANDRIDHIRRFICEFVQPPED